MTDSLAASTAFPAASRAGFRTLSPSFSPTHFHEDPSFSISVPMRLRVHNSVGCPAARAPRSSTRRSRSFWVGLNRGGRPGVGRARSPVRVLRRYACFHRTTELRAARTRRATSRNDVPARSSGWPGAAESRRRRRRRAKVRGSWPFYDEAPAVADRGSR
jgi:hypothetical protein